MAIIIIAESRQNEAHILSQEEDMEAGRLTDREGKTSSTGCSENTGSDSQTSQSKSEPESDEN